MGIITFSAVDGAERPFGIKHFFFLFTDLTDELNL